MAVHPVAALFPDVGPGELPLVAYAKDVETQGVRNPVAVQGSVFVGRPHAHEDLRSSVSGSWRENPRKGVQVRRACADT